MAEGPKPLVGNAADTGQVRDARRKEKRETQLEIDDLRAVLATPEGYRTIRRELASYGVFHEVFHQSSLIYAIAGRHDLGVLKLKKVMRADPEAYTRMVREELLQEQNDG